MIYEARVTGKYETRYWVQIPTKYGQQDVGPIKATGQVSPTIGQIVYVGYLPTADTFVILAGPEGVGVISWGDIANKPSTFTPASHNHAASNITSGTLAAARLPVVTASANGAMLAADKKKLDAATHNSTASTIAMRDANGLLATQAPTGPTHAANKSYVDAQDALRAPLSHTHTVGDLVPGTLSMTRLRLTSTTDASETSTAHAFQIGADSANNLIIDNNEVIGRNNGAFEPVSFPSGIFGLPEQLPNVSAATRKDYVDAQVATRAPLSHTHAWADVTGKPSTFAPSSHTHTWAQVTGKPSTFTPSAHTHAAADITSGTIAAARLPVATQTVHGAMPAADKKKLDNAGYDAGPSSILMTSSADYAKAGAFFVTLAQQGQAHSLTRKDYVDGLAAGKLDKAMIEIGDAADLNNYVTTGDYHQAANVRAANGTNYPAPTAGKLEVKASDSGSFVYQEYTAYSLAGRKYYRCKYNTTWYAWKEVGVRTAPAKWETVAMNTTNFGPYSTYGFAEITEDNGLVTLSAVITPKSPVLSALTGTTGQHALTIPAKYIPAKTNSLVWVLQASAQNKLAGSLESDGRFTLARYGPGTPEVGTWLPIYVHWRL